MGGERWGGLLKGIGYGHVVEMMRRKEKAFFSIGVCFAATPAT